MTYRRVLLPPVVVDEVRVEVEPEDVRVDVEPEAVLVLFVDSRLMVVVRPLSSVRLIVVRVVPDLLTRLSTVVEGATVRVVAEPEAVRVEVEEDEVVRVDVEVEDEVVADDEGEDVRPDVVVAVRPEVVVVVEVVRGVAVPEA